MNLHEHDERSFSAMIDEIMALGHDEATAARYAALIGDRPIRAEDGQIVVMENGRELARLALMSSAEAEELQALDDAYDAAFGNFAEIALPQFLYDPRFAALLRQALRRGTALTQAEVTAVFSDAAWDY